MAGQHKSFLFRHLVLSSLAIWVLIGVGAIVAGPILSRISIFRPSLNGHYVQSIAAVLRAASQNQKPEDLVQKIVQAAPSDESFGDFFIVDDSGAVLGRSWEISEEVAVDPRFLPTGPLEVGSLNNEAPSPANPVAVKISDSPSRFLIFRPPQRPGPEQFMLAAILFLLPLLVVTAMGGSAYFLLRKLRRHGGQAAEVMARLQQGQLGARLNIERMDEFGEMMVQFNNMAGEVERLFVKLQETEKARIHILQDIGHDLRTPLSSLLALFEILQNKFERMTDSERKQFLATGRREVNFTKRMVDDLLFLARVEDPSCIRNDENLDLIALMQMEIQSAGTSSTLQIKLEGPSDLNVIADAQLLRRMIRNGIHNSISYAETNITIHVGMRGGLVEMFIDDDGPGFSEHSLATFGKKRPTRIQHEDEGRRISLGLGSVIMTAIARIYSGEVQPANRYLENRVAGGRVSISLKLKASSAAAAAAA